MNVKAQVTVTFKTEIDSDDFEYDDLGEEESPSEDDVLEAYKSALEYGDLDMGEELGNAKFEVVAV